MKRPFTMSFVYDSWDESKMDFLCKHFGFRYRSDLLRKGIDELHSKVLAEKREARNKARGVDSNVL